VKDWRDQLRELGFGNQAVIVGTKRRELFDEIEKMFVERQKILELLVDDKFPAPGNLEYMKVRNKLRAELRQQIKEMK
jgi:hypothetical protein